MGEKQHLPAHLPGLSPNQDQIHHIHHIQNIHHIYQVCHPITLVSVVYEQTGAQVHNRMTMEEYGRLMVNYKDAPAEQQQKQTRQMSYVESNIDWWVSYQSQTLKIDIVFFLKDQRVYL